jgi:alpha-D-xyloside xylohydrolase
MKASALLGALMITASSAALAQTSWQRTPTGIVVTPRSGSEKAVRLELYGDSIVRVTESADGRFDTGPSFAVNAAPSAATFTVVPSVGRVTLSTDKVHASVDLATGHVSFTDARGRPQLAEYGAAGFAPVAIDGTPFLSLRQQFNRGTDEGLFGLGQHQFGQMNYNGEDVELAQHNMDVAIPFLISTRNYGLLWDNPSITRFGNPKPYVKAGSAGDGLQVDGGRGWTATYRAEGKTLFQRQESVVSYQFLENRADWPAGTRTADMANNVPSLAVTWEGRVVPPSPPDCTASGSIRRAMHACSSMAARCLIGGGRIGTPSTICLTLS